MTITVGTDTYISLVDADAYVADYYLSTDAKLVAWAALVDADKEVLLRRATQAIESIRFPGTKYSSAQTLSFPRVRSLASPLRRNPDFSLSWEEDWLDIDNVVPDEIKYAQVEEALEMASPSGDSERQARLTSGLDSFSIGHYSESIKGGTVGSATPQAVLKSIKAQELVGRFASGSFRTV